LEQLVARAQYERVDQQHVLVDEAVRHERLDQHPAAHDVQVPSRLSLQLAHCLGHAAGQQRRVGQDSGSGVCEATYFGAMFRASLIGLSVVFQ
jgi:hypothetical protein